MVGRKVTPASPSWTVTPNLASDKCGAIDAVLLATERETRPAKRRMGRFIRTPQNGFGSRAVHDRKVEKGKAKAKAKAKGSRREETVKLNHSATIGTKGMDTVDMLQRASSRTMALKGEERGNGRKVKRLYRQKR